MSVEHAIAKAIAHPLRIEILERFPANAGGGKISPNDLAKQLGEPLTNVSYHVRMLADLGALELGETEPRRGALEHYYRVTSVGVIARQHGRSIRRALEVLNRTGIRVAPGRSRIRGTA